MTFYIRATDFFARQIQKLNGQSRRIIRNKIGLIKQNPYRFKRIHSKKFNKVFRIRLSLEGRETMLIYVVLEPNIIIVCLLERKNEYKDLEKYLAKI